MADADPPLPPRIRRVPSASGLELRRSWRTPAVRLASILAVFWTALLALILLPAVLHGEASRMVWAVLALLALVGLALDYYALAGMCNSSRILLDGERLLVEHGPIPWPGRIELPRARIAHVYAKRTRSLSGHPARNEVWLVLRDGPQARLVPTNLDAEESLSLARELARALGLPEHGQRIDEGR